MPTNTSPSLLLLPDDVLKNIFKHLGDIKYTLQSSIDAVNLASTNKRLQAIFASTLTHIIPILDNCEAGTFDEQHVDKLVRIAAGNLRVLHLPDGQHAFVKDLHNICPRLEQLAYLEIHHRRGSEASLSESSEEVDADDHDDDGVNLDADNAGVENAEGENDQNDVSAHENGGGDNLQDSNVEDDNVVENAGAENLDDGDSDSGNSNGGSADDENANADAEVVNADGVNTENVDLDNAEGENIDNGNGNDEITDDDGSDNEDNDDGNSGGAASDENDEYDSDNIIQLSEIATSKYDWKGCATMQVIPRLRLRRLTLIRPPARFFDHMTHHTLEELHLHRMKKHHLNRVIPLLVRPLKALTVTIHGFFEQSFQGHDVSAFVDALIPMVPHIASLTLHVPFNQGLGTVIETWEDSFHIGFQEKAARLVASSRQNTCSSDCVKVDLKGNDTLRILSAVNKDASITLSSSRVTVRDDGEGIHFIGLPLDDEYLNQDVTRLENAFILRQCRRVDHVCNLEWGRRLAGHRLRVIRTSDARVLNKLNLSAEKLEFFCRSLADVSDWTFLSGVRELYLLGLPSNFSSKPRHRTLEVMQKLPLLIDAFEGELIWTGLFGFIECSPRPFLDDLIESAKATKEAADRFVRRGGDAATFQRYVETVLASSTETKMEASE